MKLLLRILAVLVGTAYFCASVFTILLVFPVSRGIQENAGFVFAGFAELFTGTIITGIGLGLLKLTTRQEKTTPLGKI